MKKFITIILVTAMFSSCSGSDSDTSSTSNSETTEIITEAETDSTLEIEEVGTEVPLDIVETEVASTYPEFTETKIGDSNLYLDIPNNWISETQDFTTLFYDPTEYEENSEHNFWSDVQLYISYGANDGTIDITDEGYQQFLTDMALENISQEEINGVKFYTGNTVDEEGGRYTYIALHDDDYIYDATFYSFADDEESANAFVEEIINGLSLN